MDPSSTAAAKNPDHQQHNNGETTPDQGQKSKVNIKDTVANQMIIKESYMQSTPGKNDRVLKTKVGKHVDRTKLIKEIKDMVSENYYSNGYFNKGGPKQINYFEIKQHINKDKQFAVETKNFNSDLSSNLVHRSKSNSTAKTIVYVRSQSNVSHSSQHKAKEASKVIKQSHVINAKR